MRIADAEVQAILRTTEEVEPYLIMASLVVEQHLYTLGYTEALLREIERWLAAHFFTLAHGGALQAKKIGDSSWTYETTPLGKGLNSTRYGAAVAMLDTAGILVNLGSYERARFHVE
jgi:hypothetical protein